MIKMKEKENLVEILDRIGLHYTINQEGTYLEIENRCFGENISVDFNESEKIIDIYC